MGKTIYVVMGNDYPAAVFEAEHDAEAFCEEERQKAVRISWRVYEFVLRGFELKPKIVPRLSAAWRIKMSEPTGYGPDYYKSESELRAEITSQAARIAELEAENRLLRARPMHKQPDFRDGIPSDEE